MNEKLQKELTELATEFDMDIYFQCLYCGHKREVVCGDDDESFFITFCPKKVDKSLKN